MTHWVNNFSFKLILRNLYRKKTISLLFFVVIATNFLVANIIFQAERNLNQILQPVGKK